MQGILNIRPIVAVLVMGLAVAPATAQFMVGGQYFARGEYRNGYGGLRAKGQAPFIGVGQRARIHFQFATGKASFFVSVQDVRVWGSAPQANSGDGFLSVHEAYAEVPLGELWAAKVGRQELNYDNARFLGNLDWALQARSHDFALVKFERGQVKLHFGAGYNQANCALANTPFTINNQYKAAQFVHYENVLGPLSFGLLFWNNGLEQNDQGKVKTRYVQTVGIPKLEMGSGGFAFSGFYYHQSGRDISNSKVDAHDASVQASYKTVLNAEKGKKIQATLGGEILTGTSQQANGSINRSYVPFYGTNHAHNGYMDFFYAGGRHAHSLGLQDYFLRARFDPANKVFLSVNTHRFFTAANAYAGNARLGKTLGTELDFTIGFIANEVVSLQGGYSQLFASEVLEAISGEANPALVQNWGYVALLVRPNMKNRFSGLLF